MPRNDPKISGTAARLSDQKSLIPDTFMLAGTVWTVAYSADIGELGRCERDKATILLKTDVPEQVMVSTFCHELIHAMKFMRGETDHDEKDVDAQGHLLHQFLVTRSF